MAQKVQITITSDISGEEDAQPVTFALDGVSYQIDLTESEATALRETLGDYVAKGRRVSGRKNQAKSSGKRDVSAVREWARANGWPNLGDRGRIPFEVEQAYAKAN